LNKIREVKQNLEDLEMVCGNLTYGMGGLKGDRKSISFSVNSSGTVRIHRVKK
jgi:hypothetical protein